MGTVDDFSKCFLQVCKVLEVARHPEADNLYVCQVDVGTQQKRQVVTGMVKHMTAEQLQGASFLLLCPATPKPS